VSQQSMARQTAPSSGCWLPTSNCQEADWNWCPAPHRGASVSASAA